VAYYLGIDGGGSKTTCAIGDERSALATSIAGPSNITRVEEARARESLHQVIREACDKAKINPSQIDCACIGVAGAGRQEVAGIVRKMVAEQLSGEIEVVGDMAIAMVAAFGASPGVIVIAGTGSIAYGCNNQGASARAGGWGFAISDEGSAHWIGRTAVAAVLRDMDQTIESQPAKTTAESSSLFRELKSLWKLRTLEEFVRTANSSPDFAALLPAIISTADAGDRVAQRVLEQAGVELSELAAIVIRRLFAESCASSTLVRLAMVGGVLRHSTRVRQHFSDEVRKFDPRVQVIQEIVEPVAGALQMARQAHTKSK
jgi:N-acetylglucosamine kinase-like BadF-type ATPase